MIAILPIEGVVHAIRYLRFWLHVTLHIF